MNGARHLAGFGLAVLLALTGCAHAAATSCPAAMPAPHAGFTQMGPMPARTLPLAGMRLFDGPPGEETRTSPVELAPDGTTRQGGTTTSRWRFGGDEHVLLVCTYRGTDSYYRIALPSPPAACAVTRGPRGVTGSCE